MCQLDEITRDRGRIQMNSRRATAGCLWLLVLFAAGCSGAPAVLPTQPIEAQQFHERRGGVLVGVEPYFTVERTRAAFRGGERFPESGVLPVQLTIQNGSAGEIKVDPRDFRLVRPNSGEEGLLSAQDAFSLVRTQIRYWALLPMVGSSVTAARNEPILKDLESRELRESTIPSGATTNGFVYFRIPESEKNLAGSRVMIVLKTASGQDLTYEIPMEGRRDIPVPSSSAQSVGSPAPSGAAPLTPASPTGPIRIEGAGGGVIIRSPSR
jgi:hypothetical protein